MYIQVLQDALKEIAELDYRGYPHESARIAAKALAWGREAGLIPDYRQEY
jgi:hypothetical protein